MRTRTALAAGLAVVVAAGAFSPAVAAPKAKPKPKPISKSYSASALPDASPTVVGVVCDPLSPAAKFSEPFTVPYAGTLKIDMTGFQGDWDLGVFSSGGQLIAQSAQEITDDVDRPEAISLKLKKAGQKIEIRSCNFAGGPTAAMKYVFTAS